MVFQIYINSQKRERLIELFSIKLHTHETEEKSNSEIKKRFCFCFLLFFFCFNKTTIFIYESNKLNVLHKIPTISFVFYNFNNNINDNNNNNKYNIV